MFRVWSKADRVVAISEEVKRWLVQNGVKEGKVVVIPYGVSIPTRSGSTRGGSRSLIVGTIGRLDPRKGLERVVQVWPKVRQAHPGALLKIAGRCENAYGRDLMSWASEIEGVEFLGEIPHDQIGEFFGSIDLYVQPSVEEGLGLAVLEAMAWGKAIVVSDIPAFREIVPEWQRLTGEGEWAERIVAKLNGSRDFRARTGQALQNHVRREFSVERMMERLRDVYESCTDNHPA